eukprot:3001207-Ditylum_brightwellii.AAC.1
MKEIMLDYCRSSQVNLQLDCKPISVYRQINKVTINAMYKTNNYDELKDIMKVCKKKWRNPTCH